MSTKPYIILVPGQTQLYFKSRPLSIWEALELYTDLFVAGLSPHLVKASIYSPRA